MRFNNSDLCACSGNTPETRGTAYVVYEDIFDAKNACDHLSGFNVCNRYLVVLYYNANRVRLSLPVKYTLVSVLHAAVLDFCSSWLRCDEAAHCLVSYIFFFFLSFRHSRKWTQRKKKSSWNFSRRNMASIQTPQSKTRTIPLLSKWSLLNKNEHKPYVLLIHRNSSVLNSELLNVLPL